ncbi:hypothetical protein GOV12_08225 [Candidatus Pacearchaeota archaeon]|nr:hypothetical protein [Candidatus Pacearchaeota archaeon]
MGWKNSFKEGKEIILISSTKKGEPNGIIVISKGFEDDMLLIADCQMKKTIINIKENNKICLISDYFKIKGNVKVINSGKYFKICAKKNKDCKVNNAILVNINEVYDLDKVKKIF